MMRMREKSGVTINNNNNNNKRNQVLETTRKRRVSISRWSFYVSCFSCFSSSLLGVVASGITEMQKRLPVSCSLF